MVMDLVAEAQDWPKAGEFARRFRQSLPPNMIDPDEITPEMQQQMQAQAEQQQMVAQVEMAKAQAEIENLQAQAQERMARAEQLKAQAIKAMSDADARQADVEGKNADRDFKSQTSIVDLALRAAQQEDGNDGN
jgi:hypothetical protein